MNYVFVAYGDELYHHGVMGQKWGVRRYQNSDGTYTSAGKARRNNSSSERTGLTDQQKKALKVGATVVGTAAVAAGALYIAKTNPELVAKGAKFTKTLMKNVRNGVVEGVLESSKEAPKKLTKVVITGAVMVAGKKYLDNAIGKTNSDAVFKSNDPKQIGKYWNRLNEKEKEDD